MTRPANSGLTGLLFAALIAALWPVPGHAETRVMAVLNRAADLEATDLAGVDACPGGRFQEWAVVEGDRVWTTFATPSAGTPWRERVPVGYDQDHSFALAASCTTTEGEPYREYRGSFGSFHTGENWGELTFDTTLRFNPVQPTHRFRLNLTVADGVTLDIEPGAELVLSQRMYVEGGKVVCNAATVRSVWDDIEVNSGEFEGHGCTFERLRFRVQEGGLRIDNSTFVDGSISLESEGDTGGRSEIAHNRFSGRLTIGLGADHDWDFRGNRIDARSEVSADSPRLFLGCGGSGTGQFRNNTVLHVAGAESSFGDFTVSGPCDISDNLISGFQSHGAYAVELLGAEGGTFTRNHILFGQYESQGSGLMVQAPGSQVTDNVIQHVGDDTNSAAVYFSVLEDTHNVVFDGNDFCAPIGFTVSGDGDPIDLSNNYWGDPSGPRHASNPEGGGGWIYSYRTQVDFDPWSTSGRCGLVYLEEAHLVQDVPGSTTVAGKPFVLVLRIRNGSTDDLAGVSVEGEMDGTPFNEGPFRLPSNPTFEQLHQGENLIALTTLQPPLIGPGEVNLRIHYLDPNDGTPAVIAHTLRYDGIPARPMLIQAHQVETAVVGPTLAEMVPLVEATFPTNNLAWGVASGVFAPVGPFKGRMIFMTWHLQLARKFTDIDVMVAVTPTGYLGAFGFGDLEGHVSFVEESSECATGSRNYFALAHEVGHALIGNSDEYFHEVDTPDWPDEDKPFGNMVAWGWDVPRGRNGYIHSYNTNDAHLTCPDYRPGQLDHTCNFFNFMATDCLPPKWINNATRADLDAYFLDRTGGTSFHVEETEGLIVPFTVWSDGAGEFGNIYQVEGHPDESDDLGSWQIEVLDLADDRVGSFGFEPYYEWFDDERGEDFYHNVFFIPVSGEGAVLNLVLEGEIVNSVSLIDGQPPLVTLLAPTGESTNDETLEVRWTMTDDDSDTLWATVLLSTNGGDSWQTLAVETTETDFDVPSDRLPGSADTVVRVVVTDGIHTAEARSDPFELAFHRPQVEIVHPPDGLTLAADVELNLEALGWDLDGDSVETIWTSSLDGVIGAGAVAYHSDWTVGDHTITVTATDPSGLTSDDSVGITVTASPDGDGDGLPDSWEVGWGTDPERDDADDDPDGDQLNNIEEYELGTDPLAADSDSDGCNDGEELSYESDPLHAGDDGCPDPEPDPEPDPFETVEWTDDVAEPEVDLGPEVVPGELDPGYVEVSRVNEGCGCRTGQFSWGAPVSLFLFVLLFGLVSRPRRAA